jgi:hypothetical protein
MCCIQDKAECDCSSSRTQQLWDLALKYEHREFQPVVFGNGQGEKADGSIEWLEKNWPPVHSSEKDIECFSPANFYCPKKLVRDDGWKHYVKCPKYTSSPEGSYAVTDCKPIGGYSLPIDAKDPKLPDALSATICPPNTFCPEGENVPAPTPCPINTRSPAGSAEREACKAIAGYHHNGAGYGSPVDPCPAGSYCPAESLTDTPCPANTDSPPQSSVITVCRAIAGFYGPQGTPAVICPKDNYCPAGSVTPRVCPPNTQTDGEGSTDVFACKSVAGYFGPYGTAAAQCTRNSYCPAASITPTPCPLNTFSPSGSADITSCHANAGFYGPYGSAADPCLQDNYCPSEATVPTPCPAFEGAQPQSARVVDCTSMPGYYGQPGS